MKKFFLVLYGINVSLVTSIVFSFFINEYDLMRYLIIFECVFGFFSILFFLSVNDVSQKNPPKKITEGMLWEMAEEITEIQKKVWEADSRTVDWDLEQISWHNWLEEKLNDLT